MNSIRLYGVACARLIAVATLALATLPAARLQAAVHSQIGTYPSWWRTYGVLSTGTANDFTAATMDQAEIVAVAAVAELDNNLAQFGGAGSALDNLAIALNTFENSGTANDSAAINLGQLKKLTQPFYDRLLAIGYRGPPLTTGTYPWVTSGRQADDSATANLGQLKELFSFDVSYSTYGVGIPDWWLSRYGFSLTASGTSDVPWSGGQLTYKQAYQHGLNPINFYNGASISLTIVSGSARTGSPGGFVSLPLVVLVADANGQPMTGAPVAFGVPADGGNLQTSSTGKPITAVTILTDGSGDAQVFYKLPNVVHTTGSIAVVAGTATQTVNEYSDGGGDDYLSPFAPSDIVGTFNSDGSEAITWQNNDNISPIYVYLMVTSGSWVVTGTLAAGTTSFTTSPAHAGMTEIGNNYSPGGSTGAHPGGGTWPGPGDTHWGGTGGNRK